MQGRHVAPLREGRGLSEHNLAGEFIEADDSCPAGVVPQQRACLPQRAPRVSLEPRERPFERRGNDYGRLDQIDRSGQPVGGRKRGQDDVRVERHSALEEIRAGVHRPPVRHSKDAVRADGLDDVVAVLLRQCFEMAGQSVVLNFSHRPGEWEDRAHAFCFAPLLLMDVVRHPEIVVRRRVFPARTPEFLRSLHVGLRSRIDDQAGGLPAIACAQVARLGPRRPSEEWLLPPRVHRVVEGRPFQGDRRWLALGCSRIVTGIRWLMRLLVGVRLLLMLVASCPTAFLKCPRCTEVRTKDEWESSDVPAPCKAPAVPKKDLLNETAFQVVE